MRKHLNSILVPAAVLVSLAGCTSREPARGRTNAKEKAEIVELRTKALADAQQKRLEYTTKVKAMDATQLAAALQADSERGLEPFNSLAFAEAISRGNAGASGLAAAMNRSDRSSLLTLLAIRQASPGTYGSIAPARRVEILVDALRASKSFNTWGLPHVRWEYASQSLIGEGAAAVKPLSALLTDKRAAPVWGSEDFLEYDRYKYRVCDYAWAMLAAIRNQRIDIPLDPVARDRQIATPPVPPR
jgi:hypothetical protein